MDLQDKRHQLCTWPNCGKNVKDLASHLLTHQRRRPFKCPVQWCQYATKGFARKYDRTRHALKHWKAVTRCKFCPESLLGLDVNFFGLNELKSHLRNVHEAEATDAGSSSRAPGNSDHSGSVICSACHQVFVHVQTFYSHLDDCVLESLKRDNPIDDINTRNLAPVVNDQVVLETLARHGLSSFTGPNLPSDATFGTSLWQNNLSRIDDDVEAASAPDRFPREPDDDDGMVSKDTRTKSDRTKRRNRRHYPASWGFNVNQTTVRKRRLIMFDGTERLHTDEMTVARENEVHVEFSKGNSYVTDLDLRTLNQVAEIDAMREVGTTGAVGDDSHVLGQLEPGELTWLNSDGYDWSTIQAVSFT
ncbi:hypothetical protein CEP54_015974 [Fusarium duplospermum]|uniref:C2H2-type domain-containing protein n=1 Tax=Fusarium duplospermum TaxID=1325734 RepID=A0A428NJD6_9HYPO|nr:hypothetical protein CEP54_015974 [Fusarium duplospermum]